MAGQISIGAARQIDRIRDRLDTGFQLLRAEGFKLHLDETEIGDYSFLGCNMSGSVDSRYSPDEARLLFRNYIASVISDAIVNDWEEHLVNKLVKEHYNYFNEEERRQIVRQAFRNLNQGDVYGFYPHKTNRRTRVLQKIMEYLENHSELFIDGFVKFRLKEYVRELRDAVDMAVDEFLMEKEYHEFIRLLRYFVEIQEPRVVLLHVVVRPNGYFQLFDGEHKPVNSDYLDGFSLEGSDMGINYEDLLISALISLAPKKLIIHMSGGSGCTEAVNTIKKVFDDRVTHCPGCDRFFHARQESRDR